jgi:hypothetical protein
MASKLVTYVPRPMPTLGGDQLYLQQELASISNAIGTANAAIKSDEAAWTPYTPTVTIPSGAGTATGRYKQIGKTVFINIDVTITTGGASCVVSLPTGITTASSIAYISGGEVVVSGATFGGRIAGTTLILVCANPLTAAVTTGNRIILSGSFEAA